MKKRIISSLLALAMVMTMPMSMVLADDETLLADSVTSGQETSDSEAPVEGNEDTVEDVATETPVYEEISAKDDLITLYTENSRCIYDNFYYTISNNEITVVGHREEIGYDKIRNITIPSEINNIPVTAIGKSAFSDCEYLTDVIVSEGVTKIDDSAFSNCKDLTSITIPDTITYIGDNAFYYCYKLTSISIPDNVTYIGSGAFNHCRGITSIHIPSKITSINSDTFMCCTGLASINIPDNVTSIGLASFMGCESLTNITISKGVSSIVDGAFWDCPNLTSINVSNENKNYSSEDGVLFNKDRTELLCYPSGKSGTYVIPYGVAQIGTYAFLDCRNLTNITIQNNVTRICVGAFSGCTGLTSIKIPSSVTLIQDYAFSGCSSLTSITIPSSVSEIGHGSFIACNELKDIYYSGSKNDWESISIGVDNECLLNATIHYNSTGADNDSDYTLIKGTLRNADGCEIIWTAYYKPDSTGQPKNVKLTIAVVNADNTEEELYLCNDVVENVFPWELEPYNITKSAVTELVIHGESNKKLCTVSGMFQDYTNLREATFTNVSSIDSYTFDGCKNLTTLSFYEGSPTTIGSCAFRNCSKLEYMTLDKETIYIGANAFQNCKSLGVITLQKEVTNIGKGAFDGSNIVIRCYYQSAAHKYAVENNIEVRLIDPPAPEYKVYYHHDGERYYEPFKFSLDDVLDISPSNIYSSKLAHILIAMCNSVYWESDIRDTMSEFGFEDIKPFHYDKNEVNSVTYTLGKKQTSNGKKIVLVTLRGTNGLGDDFNGWLSNANLGLSATVPGWHAGFEQATNEVYDNLLKYIGYDLTNTTFVITGFSRGAAVANLLEVKLFNAKVPQANVYGYNFACPDVAVGLPTGWNWFGEHDNIFNIANNCDPVSQIPGILGDTALIFKGINSWGKFGKSRWYYDSIDFGAHDQWKYLNFLDDEPYFYTFSENPPTDIVGKMINAFCPVDIIVKDKNGNKIASVIGEEVNYYDSEFGKVIIFTDGDKKSIYVQGNDPLTINLTGTDNGTMEYFVQTVNLYTKELLSEKTFKAVSIEAGKEFLSMTDVEEITGIGDDVSRVPLYVIDGNGMPEKEVLPDGNGTEVPINNDDTPTTPTAPDNPTTPDTPSKPTVPDNGESASNTNASTVAPFGGTNTESLTVTVENKVTGKTSKARGQKTGSSAAIKLGTENDGYFANVYTTDGEYICSALIENGRAKFTVPDNVKLKIVIDSIAYGEDVSSEAGSSAENKSDSIPYPVIITLIAVLGIYFKVGKKHFSQKTKG